MYLRFSFWQALLLEILHRWTMESILGELIVNFKDFFKFKLLLSDLISTKMRALQLLSSNGYGNSYSNGMMSSYNGGYPTNGFSNGYSNGIMPSFSNYNSYPSNGYSTYPSNGYSAYPSNSNLGCTTCPRYYSSMYNSYPMSMYHSPYAGNYGYNGLNSIGKK